MTDLLLSSTWFGFLLSTGTFFLAKAVNRRCGRERINPLLFATVVCGLVIIISGMDYDVYYQGAQYLDVLLTPATICLAIPLYRQFELLKKNIPAVAAGCLTGVVAHMVGCILMLVLFQLEAEEFITLLPKSITTAIGKGLSEELGGYASITMATIMLTGIFGTVIAPPFLRLTGVRDPLAQGLAIGTSAHAAGTSRAVEMGEIQGAASSLAIVVTGLLTVIAAPILAHLAL